MSYNNYYPPGHIPPPFNYVPQPPPTHIHEYVSATTITHVYPPPGPPPPQPPPYPGNSGIVPPHYQQYQPQVQAPPPPPVPEKIDWVPSTPHTTSSVSKAFVGGKEGWEGSPLYVIRADYNGELIPGKYAVKHRQAYIPNATKEISVHNFEVLSASPNALQWIPSSHGKVPPGALPAGHNRQRETLYIGRARHALFSTVTGKVHPSHNCCYIPYGGKEHTYKHYEVLCKVEPTSSW